MGLGRCAAAAAAVAGWLLGSGLVRRLDLYIRFFMFAWEESKGQWEEEGQCVTERNI